MLRPLPAAVQDFMNITVFDEHHEVFLFWEESIASGKLHKGSTLLHVDGHADLAAPWVQDSVYSPNVRRFVRTQLNIGNFILPAVLRGIFNQVIFLDRARAPRKKEKHNIGTLYGSGRWINMDFPKDRLSASLYPDAKEWQYTIIGDASDIKAQDFTLDIDLDYFYGYYSPRPQYEICLSDRQLKHVKKMFLSDDKYKISLNKFAVEKRTLRAKTLRGLEDVICNSSREWIECAIKYFTDSLKVKPASASICRSVKSGYTPAKHAQYAEETLIKYLKGHKGMDYSDIVSAFEVYPFITRVGDIIYNPLLNKKMELERDNRFIWDGIARGKNLRQIFKDMFSRCEGERKSLEKEVLKFIFYLKGNFFIK
ncbi:MAG: hypothetical protein A2X34_03190 [Elusimicrobia bacterium GWC2_51_8]|nr:MAG: hypothetical protein A2X33_06085 [Elusimicrobia bacterium GWA2_51_34]OGR61973.1 MAG: hypothetical protein A2X34_03190 [Elusimicrobia bacterium GWC2_51_8]OGR85199.1 MAG: hypothetical protein A2021_00450 [Elusimicrobia bacterium GWF2_52_66]